MQVFEKPRCTSRIFLRDFIYSFWRKCRGWIILEIDANFDFSGKQVYLLKLAIELFLQQLYIVVEALDLFIIWSRAGDDPLYHLTQKLICFLFGVYINNFVLFLCNRLAFVCFTFLKVY